MALAVAAAATPVAAAGQALPNPAACDSALGKDYDRKSAEEKSARMTEYLNCRSLQDLGVLQARRQVMQRAVQEWQARAARVTRSSLHKKWEFAGAELATAQHAERTKLVAEYDTKYAEVKAAGTQANYYETNRKINDVSLKRREDFHALDLRHAEDTRGLRETFVQCEVKINDRIARMAAGDLSNLDRQFIDKSETLKREYDSVRATPMNMSVAKHDAQQRASAPQPAGSQGATGTPPAQAGSAPASGGSGAGTDEDNECKIVFAGQGESPSPEGAKPPSDEPADGPADATGKSKANFSWLRGLFLFTSELVGRREPKDVEVIYGDLGIRG